MLPVKAVILSAMRSRNPPGSLDLLSTGQQRLNIALRRFPNSFDGAGSGAMTGSSMGG